MQKLVLFFALISLISCAQTTTFLEQLDGTQVFLNGINVEEDGLQVQQYVTLPESTCISYSSKNDCNSNCAWSDEHEQCVDASYVKVADIAQPETLLEKNDDQHTNYIEVTGGDVNNVDDEIIRKMHTFKNQQKGKKETLNNKKGKNIQKVEEVKKGKNVDSKKGAKVPAHKNQ